MNPEPKPAITPGPKGELIGHFYDEGRARGLVEQFVTLGHDADRFTVVRDRFGEWLVYCS